MICSSHGQRLSVAAHSLLATVAGVLFWRVLPHGGWDRPELLAVLVVLAVLSVGAGALLGSPAQFDATLAVVMVALVTCGPLPALAVDVLAEIAALLLVRGYAPPKHIALANATSFAWAIVAAWAVIGALGWSGVAGGALALVVAGLANALTNFVIARGIAGPLAQGLRPINLVRHELVPMIPAVLVVLLLAAGTAALIPSLGVLALLVFAVTVGVPQGAMAALVRTRSVADLEPLEATRLYAGAIADRLGIDSRQRGFARAAADLLEASGPAGSSGSRARAFEDAIGGEHSVIVAALYAGERWDGSGRPGQLAGNAIPETSRVLAVAQAWSELTARGTVELSHADALARISQQTGFAFDPVVVEAASAVIRVERALDPAPAFEPRLHRLPGPRAVRGVLPRLVGDAAATLA